MYLYNTFIEKEDIEFVEIDKDKVGEMRPGKYGRGVRWCEDKNNQIRIMPGNPDADYEGQRCKGKEIAYEGRN